MRQYGMADEAVRLGWARTSVTVIDADLGASGRFGAAREGFRQVVTKVCLGEAGAIFGLEVSRLARSSADFARLLELARLTDTLLIDDDGIYDLADINDRLLLGLKGQMSEALCRDRHNASYVDPVVMPPYGGAALVEGRGPLH
jgi:DNA invertase Pin-like site-specific DNA recombinase